MSELLAGNYPILTLMDRLAVKSALNASSNESYFADISRKIIFILSEYGNNLLTSVTDILSNFSLSRINAAVTDDSGNCALYELMPAFWMDDSLENLTFWNIVSPCLLINRVFLPKKAA